MVKRFRSLREAENSGYDYRWVRAKKIFAE